MKTYKCKVCGEVFQSDAENPICPRCKKGGDALVEVKLQGSKTEQNLWTAFAGESQARNKYTYFVQCPMRVCNVRNSLEAHLSLLRLDR